MLWKAMMLGALAVAGLPPMSPAHAENEFLFFIGSIDPGFVICRGPYFRTSKCTLVSRNTQQPKLFYQANDNLFSPFRQDWTCEMHNFHECTDSPKSTVKFCLENSDVILQYNNAKSFTVNQPDPGCVGIAPRTRSVLGFDGEDATPRSDIDTFDFTGKSGETLEVTLERDGASGSIGSEATLRVQDPSGGTLAEDTGTLPLRVELHVNGPVAVSVLKRSGEGSGLSRRLRAERGAQGGQIGSRALRPRHNVEF
jgi:hypothetical protein